MNRVIDLKAAAAGLAEYWSPRVVGEIDDSYAKVAKLKGDLPWHQHEHEDELFLVLDGSLTLEMKDRSVTLRAGEMFVVPKATPHHPVAVEECTVLLIEKKVTRHTGDLELEITRSVADQLRPL